MSEAHKGKPSGRKGKPCSEETRMKIGEANRGRKHSLGTKKKMSETHEQLWQDPKFVQHFIETHPSSFFNTKSEKTFERILNDEGFIFGKDYIKHPALFGLPDFLVFPNYCIFLDGKRFHSTPRRINRDNEITLTLMAMGYHVVRFWSREVFKNPEKIRNFLKLQVFPEIPRTL
jgi:very-short-patch-repair endonuclease